MTSLLRSSDHVHKPQPSETAVCQPRNLPVPAPRGPGLGVPSAAAPKARAHTKLLLSGPSEPHPSFSAQPSCPGALRGALTAQPPRGRKLVALPSPQAWAFQGLPAVPIWEPESFGPGLSSPTGCASPILQAIGPGSGCHASLPGASSARCQLLLIGCLAQWPRLGRRGTEGRRLGGGRCGVS